MIFQFYSSQRGDVQRSCRPPSTHNPQHPVEILVFTQHKVLPSEYIQSVLSLSRTHKNSGCRCAKNIWKLMIVNRRIDTWIERMFYRRSASVTVLCARWKYLNISLFSGAFKLVLMARIHYISVEIHQNCHYHTMDIIWKSTKSRMH